MNNKNLIILGALAVILGCVAVFVNRGARPEVPSLNGECVFSGLDLDAIASIEFGDRLKISSDDQGWRVDTYHGYPADRRRLTEAVLRLPELKVWEVVPEMKLAATSDLVLRGSDGKELARLPVGERHEKWGRGRYAAFKGETVLVSDTFDAFDGDGKALVETKIVDTPYISFSDVVENVPEAELGFATGVVAKVTIAGDTNRTVTVGNVVKGGSDRYLKLDQGKWVYKVSSYSVDSLLPKPPPVEEKKDESESKAEVKEVKEDK